MSPFSGAVRLILACSLAVQCSASDWAFGIFVRDKGMLLHGMHMHTANTGVLAFAASFINRTSSPRLAMLVDEGTGIALQRYCAYDGSKRCLLLRPEDVVAISGLPGGSSVRFLARSSLFVRRWWLYKGMMALARAQDPDAPSGMALVADVRDVLWQDDIFVRLRTQAAASHLDASRHEHPLFFAVEPFEGTVKDEVSFNVPCAAQCFPPAVLSRFGHMPLSCAGTTGGSWRALAAYAQAMQAHTLFCTGPGKQGRFEGIDQPMHMYALFDTILGRQGEPHWESRYGALFNKAARASFPLHPSRDEEPLYALLARAARLQFDDGNSSSSDSNGGSGIRVVPLPLHHHDGTICTLAMVPWTTFSKPADNGYADITAAGRAGGPQCALVHQYDRHARLVKLVDVKYAGLDPRTAYWDPTTNETY